MGSAKLLHFIASPKPWDISYARRERDVWSRHAEVVRMFLSAADWSELVIAANGGPPCPEDSPSEVGEGGGAEYVAERTEDRLEERVICLSNGRRIAFHVGSGGAAGGAYFVLGVRKSGSSLLNSITQALSKHNGLPFVDVEGMFFEQNVRTVHWVRDLAINDLLSEGNVYGGFRTAPLAFASNNLFQVSKKVLLVRDPRDALVSEHFSNAYSHRIPNPSPESDGVNALMIRQREQALSTPINDYVLLRAKEMNQTLIRHSSLIRENNTLVLKYEDVIFDKRSMIESICKHFYWNVDEELILEIIRWADVFPRTEDPKAFVRKVIPGDYMEKLSLETIRKINKILKPSMELFGYQPI